MSLDDLSPQQRAEELRRRLGKSPLATKSKEFDSDLVPEIPAQSSVEDQEIDQVIASIDLAEAYSRLIGKMVPTTRRDEGVMISCPLPWHPDTNPSAWLNLEKKLWFCGGCQRGGDIYDLAAVKFNYDIDNYKTKEIFPKLRRELAKEYGFQVVKGLNKTYLVPPDLTPTNGSPVPVTLPTPEIADNENKVETSDNVGGVVLSFPSPDKIPETSSGLDDLQIDWHKIAPPDTFLRTWMEACTIDDLPHEYYFWLGLQALGFAAGTNILLQDYQPVKANLFVCLYGKTGIGKSRSLAPYLRLLNDVMPWTGEDDPTTDPSGVLHLSSPGSSEALIDSFTFEVLDPATSKLDHLAQVKGLLKIEEFASFISRASRTGSSLKETLIEMYDVLRTKVTTHSRKSGITQASSPFCQMITTTQPRAIHAYLRKTDAESGFLNRWVLAAGKPRVTPIAYGHTAIDISKAARFLRDITAWAMDEKLYILEGDALEAWQEFFYSKLTEIKSGKEDVDNMSARIDLTLKKIIILLCVNEKLEKPTGDAVRRAVSLYEYLTVTYSSFSKDIIFNDVTGCQQKIVAIVEHYQDEYKKCPTRRDINKMLGGKYETEIQVKAFRHLIELDVIQELEPDKGSKGVRYKYAQA